MDLSTPLSFLRKDSLYQGGSMTFVEGRVGMLFKSKGYGSGHYQIRGSPSFFMYVRMLHLGDKRRFLTSGTRAFLFPRIAFRVS
jgi:hypothetical protein